MSARTTIMAGFASAALLAFSATSSAEKYPEISLRFGHFAPSTTAHAQVDAWFAEELKKRSNGQITQQIFWNGAAGESQELLDLVGQRAVDVAAVPPSYFPAQLPLLSTPSALPLALPNPEIGQTVVHTLWEEFPAFQEEAKQNNVWPIFFHTLNKYHLLCNTPVRTMEDLKGLRIRSQGEYFPMAINAVGAVPVTVLPSEFYGSLQRGSVDCMLLPWDLMTAFRLQEVGEYASTINFGSLISNPQWFNLDVWNGFSPKVKELFMDIAEDAKKRDLDMVQKAEQQAIDDMKAAGVEMVEFQDQAKFEETIPDFLSVWQKKMEEKGRGDLAKRIVERWRSML